MTTIIRELPSGKGFKLSYQYGNRCETINFYYSNERNCQFGIIRDERVMDPKNNLHNLLEVISVRTYNHEKANELALFRTYEHVKNHVERHSFVSNQQLIDKTRFAFDFPSKRLENRSWIDCVAGLFV